MVHSGEGYFESAGSSDLMVITRSLGFNDVLVASQGITIVHVAEFQDQLVHLDIVHLLFSVYRLRLCLDNVVVFSANGQVQLVVDGHLFEGYLLRLRLEIFVRLELPLLPHFVDTLFDLAKLDMGVHAPLRVSVLILSLCENASAPALQIVLVVPLLVLVRL